MVSCHLLLGEPWYKEHHVAYDCHTQRYTVKKGKKDNLVPMDEEHFITWRKKHQEKMKEQEDANMKKVKSTKI
jgi:hypothetical protein